MDFIKNLLDPTILEEENCSVGVLVLLHESLTNAHNYYTALSKNPNMVLSFTDILHYLSVIDQNLEVVNIVIEVKKLDIFDDYCLNYEEPELLICLN
jgi:hypothetical protein